MGERGKTLITRQDGSHRVDVSITVEAKPSNWPEAFLLGDAHPQVTPGEHLIVTDVDIRVDGCPIEQPWPGLRGMSMPYAARLSYGHSRWQLEIYGSGDAEAYNMTHTFDTQRIRARSLGWGALHHDEAHYDISVDPDQFADQCLVARSLSDDRPSEVQ